MNKKQEPCKFCDIKKHQEKGFILLNEDTAEYSGLTISLLSKGPYTGAVLRVRSLTDDRLLVDSQDAIGINYCPICGRRLTIGRGTRQI